MIVNKIDLNNTPVLLWGEDSKRRFLAVHGKHSSKEDDCIRILAEEAVPLGYQVISFDLPGHGERTDRAEPCLVQDCVRELKKILAFALEQAESVSVFGCSMGAYYCFLACNESPVDNGLFLSPVTDMGRIIHNIMDRSHITEEQLRSEKRVENPYETLYWDDYTYVRNHPVTSWNHPASILYGEHDNICEYSCVLAFAKASGCGLEVQAGGEHWFHTPEELDYYRGWIRRMLPKNQ